MSEEAKPRQIGCGTVLLAGVLLTCVGSMILGALTTASSKATSNEPSATIPAGPKVERPVKQCNVVLINSYAESLFTLDVTVLGKRVDGDSPLTGKKVRVFERERVPGHQRVERENLFMMSRGADVKFTLAGTSLGETRYFTATLPADRRRDTLKIEYDWDVATAAFTISYEWR